MNFKAKTLSFILTVSILFYSVFSINIQVAKAWMLGGTLANMFPETMGATGTWQNTALTLAVQALDKLQAYAIASAKVAALITVQQATKLIIGGPKGDTVIHDYNTYLYVSPQQIAMSQMNSFFNTVSKGRASSMNYEGVGPNYDAYLIGQARQAMAGQPFATDLQDQVTEPGQMFSGGNMKGVMAYLQCANNVMCYTLVSSSKYNQEFTKAQDIARSEAVNGFIPRKINGRIVQPASIAQQALSQIDQLGTQLIMTAQEGKDGDKTAAYYQIAQGAAMTLAARTSNFFISDDAGQAAIRNKNDQFPFSLSYNNQAGLNMSAGGVVTGTGVGPLIDPCKFNPNTSQCCTKSGGSWVNNKCTK